MNRIAPSASLDILTIDQERELGAQIQFLLDMPDSDIDFSDIPPLGQRGSVLGPFTPREPHVVTLRLESQVISWLEAGGKNRGHSINFSLRQAARDQQREDREKHTGVANPIYDSNSKEFLRTCKLLAGMEQIDTEYVQVPELTDRQLFALFVGPWAALEEHSLTLNLDLQVMEWLKAAIGERDYRINFAFKQSLERDMAASASANKIA